MPTNSRRTLFATLIGIALATGASHGSAAPQADAGVATSASAPQVVSLQSPRAEIGASRAAAPLTLQLEDAGGNAIRLVHLPGVGWQYDRAARAAESSLQKAALQTTAAPSAGTSGDDVPLTMFIDGPSGFTYVWNRNEGWKYVGRLVDDTL